MWGLMKKEESRIIVSYSDLCKAMPLFKMEKLKKKIRVKNNYSFQKLKQDIEFLTCYMI